MVWGAIFGGIALFLAWITSGLAFSLLAVLAVVMFVVGWTTRTSPTQERSPQKLGVGLEVGGLQVRWRVWQRRIWRRGLNAAGAAGSAADAPAAAGPAEVGKDLKEISYRFRSLMTYDEQNE